MIQCLNVIPWQGGVVALKKKLVLPGGQWKKGETFVECARRTLLEQTGMYGSTYRLIFQGRDENESYVYVFEARVTAYIPDQTVIMTWAELQKGEFKGFYELVEDAQAKQTYFREPTSGPK